jgi:hypothetical protein
VVVCRCPFYGFRWPEGTDTLVGTGTDECGLDFNNHGQCVMRRDGRDVNYYACEVAIGLESFIPAAALYAKFRPVPGSGTLVLFDEWRARTMRR